MWTIWEAFNYLSHLNINGWVSDQNYHDMFQDFDYLVSVLCFFSIENWYYNRFHIIIFFNVTIVIIFLFLNHVRCLYGLSLLPLSQVIISMFVSLTISIHINFLHVSGNIWHLICFFVLSWYNILTKAGCMPRKSKTLM